MNARRKRRKMRRWRARHWPRVTITLVEPVPMPFEAMRIYGEMRFSAYGVPASVLKARALVDPL